ncbi:TIGR02678 family protein [Nocardiopsis ansamitocini]|uniref:TIGR02678 family protein n=1 Tax=Nocardiopsis ansamitocini TaxID=1670832 RepID=A0A9W6UKP4_9ACTN|nr:TIGR02678 family protein [Nocardiopsis ansamitocini]GLU49265.1 hypothetical protein Nans01_36160 [Nocardiopsis ansamitocini]
MAAKEDIALTVERQAAARRLLADPLITTGSHPDEFPLVHAHSDWLIRCFHRVLGYHLTVADDHARLVKTGLVDAVVAPLPRTSGAPFTPRAYTYLALTLAALADSPARTTVAELAAGVREAAAEAGLRLDPERRMGERRAFTAGLVRLTEWGALTVPEGSLDAYAMDGTAEVAMNVDHTIAGRILAHPPNATADPTDFVALVQHDSTAPDDRAAELTLRRLLAENSVVYRAELGPEHRSRLAGHQWRAVAELGELLGCEAEIRAEGVALIMPASDAADARGPKHSVGFPSTGPVGHAALTLLGRLATLLDPPPFTHAIAIPPDMLATELAAAIDAPETKRWARTALSHNPDPADLSERILDLLTRSRLIDHQPEQEPTAGRRLLAAAARYRIPAPGTAEPTEPTE